MLPRKRRLTTELFNQIIEFGTFFNSPLFSFRAIKTEGKSRFSVVASKKIFKTAPERNRVRRRVYAQIEHLIPRISDGFQGIFLTKAAIKESTPEAIQTSLSEIFVKTKIIK
jgi:ribonuclease P protein component